MIILGLGANEGNRIAALKKAVEALSTILTEIQVSPLYESEALLPENAPADWNKPFLNQAVAGETALAPLRLLETLKKIEQTLGRIDRGRWSPREIDIDILAYHDEVIETADLTIPHKALLERDFALIPLAQVAPHWRYPVPGPDYGKTAEFLVQRVRGVKA
jgi:2-amino-4-hydroxy-6-hydroxymethyldihydropteridine diphosphokinase/dihydropteroate synthase